MAKGTFFIRMFLAGLFFSNIAGIKAQSILDIFEVLPDSVVLNISQADRKAIIAYSKDNKSYEDAIIDLQLYKTKYAFEHAAIDKHYLKLIGSFEGNLVIKSWDMYARNTKLVGVYMEACGPICGIEKLSFYNYSINNGFIPLSITEVLPLEEINAGIINSSSDCTLPNDDILDYVLFDFYNNDNTISVLWNNDLEFPSQCFKAELLNLYLLPDQLQSTTYFGVKK